MTPFSGLGNIVRTLQNPNYRIYTAGNAVSLIGTWMQRVVTGWLTWELTGSGAWLGVMVFADLFPTVLIGPLGGAYADRVDRLRVTQVSQALSMLQAVALFILTATGLIDIWLLLALTLFLGIVTAFNQPARLAIISGLVPPRDLTSAVAVNSVVFNLARFIGPALAGVLIATAGVSLAYAVNALTFIAFQVALARIKLADEPAQLMPASAGLWRDLAAGLRYTASHLGIGAVLILMLAANVGARPLIELLPGFAAAVFRSGPTGLALLTSSVGVGAIVAGLWLGGRSGREGLSAILLANTLLSAAAAALFAATDAMWLAVPVLVLAGFSMTSMGVSAQTLIQVSVEASMRARVLSIYGLLFRAGPALGALIMGAASERVGLRLPVVCGAGLVTIVWAWGWLRRSRIAKSFEGP